MTPPVSRERKRQRPRPPLDDPAHSDDDAPHASDDLAPRPGQAERKRELERNRRNLVNVRFVELEAELRRCMPRPDHPAPDDPSLAAAKGKRIDKEAVLKDAAQRLAVQRKDLNSSAERMAAMTAEIENLRAEKVELRGDKNYLRSELVTMRGDVQRLRSDNINLWQAFKKASSFKDTFAPDVAKIPAELFMRAPQEQLTSATPISNALIQQGVPMRPAPVPQPQNSPQLPLSSTALPLAPLLQVTRHEQQEEHHQRQDQQRRHVSQHQVCTSSPVLNDSQPRSLQQSVIPTQTSSQVSAQPVASDSFLILQTPEELGELFSNYVPGSMAPNFANTAPPESEPLQSSNQRFSANPSVGLPQSAPHTPSFSQPQYTQETPPLAKNYEGAQHSYGVIGMLDTGTGSSPKPEKEEEPSSDVAFCV